MPDPLWGKYRGVVTKSVDPKKLGRVMVSVPSVMGNETAWAMPCVPTGTMPFRVFFKDGVFRGSQ